MINLEGNLCPEDCMFSRRAVAHTLQRFGATEFEQIIEELRGSRYAGDQIIAHCMELNVDVRAYHAYSVQTVAESDSLHLIEEFLQLRVPRLFIYGEANKTLSYLPRLRASAVEVVEIPNSAHFMYYDNPVATFQAMGDFAHAHGVDGAR